MLRFLRLRRFSSSNAVPPPPPTPPSAPSWEPPRRVLPGRAPPKRGQKDGFVYLTMGALFVAFPCAISLIKGLEKRFMWKPAPAEIESVTADDITYRYAARGKIFRHSQKRTTPRAGEVYMPGDRVFVNVHTRNEQLSILDPPLFQNIIRDFWYDPYRGERIAMDQ